MTHIYLNLHNLPRSLKRAIMMAIDAIWLPVCLWLAYCLRLSSWWPMDFIGEDWWVFVFVSIVGVAIFSQMSVYRTILRYAGMQAAVQILKGVGLVSLALMALVFLVGGLNMPRSVPIIFLLVGLMYVGGTRLIYRIHYQWMIQRKLNKESILIYGAGAAGVQISMALADSAEYRVIAFLDDNKQLQGSLVQGKRVYSIDNLEHLIQTQNIQRILLAIPSAPRETRRRIVERLKTAKIKVLTLPSMPEIITGEAKVDLIKSVEIEDLLGRDPIPPIQELMQASIKGKTVMITGAGGSIGSEICRQVMQQDPSKIIINDHSEYNLYTIEQELNTIKHDKNSNIEIYAVLGSVCDKNFLNRVISSCKVQTMYHAAAYKHVPMIEKNIFVGLQNNVFGTQIACQCAVENSVERFVLISTDKAVRPTNIMGATKRTAELVIQDMAAHSDQTVFCMVRFGNVLDSSGSVIPLFRKQIAKGGPITVTHPDITRYFMTINEAASLVIQAGSMAVGGEVFVLDMGEEVKIISLAKQIIHLSGLEVRNDNGTTGDIQIVFTGLRPGEKIREELLIGNNVTGTQHPRIMRALEHKLPRNEIIKYLNELQHAQTLHDVFLAKTILKKIVSGYQPSNTPINGMLF